MSSKEAVLKYGDSQIVNHRATLKRWLQLEDIKAKVLDAVERQDTTIFANEILSYLSTATDKEWNETFWLDAIVAFQQLETLNTIEADLPIIKYKEKQDTSPPWDYPGRAWYYWANMLAKEYGWSLDTIAALDVHDAFALIQEIYTQRQLDQEWAWGLSDKSVEYNATTKISRFKPLPRPSWMLPSITVKKIPMLRRLLPIGLVNDLSGLYNGLTGPTPESM